MHLNILHLNEPDELLSGLSSRKLAGDVVFGPLLNAKPKLRVLRLGLGDGKMVEIQ